MRDCGSSEYLKTLQSSKRLGQGSMPGHARLTSQQGVCDVMSAFVTSPWYRLLPLALAQCEALLALPAGALEASQLQGVACVFEALCYASTAAAVPAADGLCELMCRLMSQARQLLRACLFSYGSWCTAMQFSVAPLLLCRSTPAPQRHWRSM